MRNDFPAGRCRFGHAKHESGCAVFFRNSPAVYVQPPPHSRVTLFAWNECEDHWPVSQLWVLISSNLYTEQTLAHPSYAKNTLADFIGVEISALDQAYRLNLDAPPKFIDDPSRLGEALIR
jgi:hypothetical protein